MATRLVAAARPVIGVSRRGRPNMRLVPRHVPTTRAPPRPKGWHGRRYRCAMQRSSRSPIPPEALERLEVKMRGKAIPEGPCRLWTGSTNRDGHPVVALGELRFTVARVVWEMENGPIPANHECAHTCGNLRCIRKSHLVVRRRGSRRTLPVADRAARGGVKVGDHLIWRDSRRPLSAHSVHQGASHTTIARALWVEANGPLPENIWVGNQCGVQGCVAVDHLYTYDQHQHGAYLVLTNAMPLGEQHWNHKLTWAKVDRIRHSPATDTAKRRPATAFQGQRSPPSAEATAGQSAGVPKCRAVRERRSLAYAAN